MLLLLQLLTIWLKERLRIELIQRKALAATESNTPAIQPQESILHKALIATARVMHLCHTPSQEQAKNSALA